MVSITHHLSCEFQSFDPDATPLQIPCPLHGDFLSIYMSFCHLYHNWLNWVEVLDCINNNKSRQTYVAFIAPPPNSLSTASHYQRACDKWIPTALIINCIAINGIRLLSRSLIVSSTHTSWYVAWCEAQLSLNYQIGYTPFNFTVKLHRDLRNRNNYMYGSINYNHQNAQPCASYDLIMHGVAKSQCESGQRVIKFAAICARHGLHSMHPKFPIQFIC